MKIEIEIPEGLYADLAALARPHEQGYRPEDYASDLVCAELASRRLIVAPGKTQTHYGPLEYRIALPQRR